MDALQLRVGVAIDLWERRGRGGGGGEEWGEWGIGRIGGVNS